MTQDSFFGMGQIGFWIMAANSMFKDATYVGNPNVLFEFSIENSSIFSIFA